MVVALGSNLGDRQAHIRWAAAALARQLDNARLSPIIETEAEGVVDTQPPYLNAVVVGECRLVPRELLEWLLDLEGQRHRVRRGFRDARTLDLDLILYGQLVVTEPDLQVPHPRFRERRFVLEPLAAIAPDTVDPVTGLTVRALLDRLRAPGPTQGSAPTSSP